MHYSTGKLCKHGHLSPRFTATAICVECNRLQSQKWYADNPDKIQKMRANTAPQAKKKSADRSARWRTENGARTKAGLRAWYLKNKDYVAQTTKVWRASNPEKVRISRLAWEGRNPEAKKANTQNRRARNLMAEGSHSRQDISAIFNSQRKRCAYCPTSLKGRVWHVDHIVALSRHGSNRRSNLQILCAPCNLSKGARDPIDFARQRGLLI